MKQLLALVGGLVFGITVAFAQSSFEEIDANGDGAINKDEAAVHEQLSAAFDAADADQDGSLTQDEFDAVVQQ